MSLTHDWRQIAIENTVSSDFMIRVRRLLKMFSIAAYSIWLKLSIILANLRFYTIFTEN